MQREKAPVTLYLYTHRGNLFVVYGTGSGRTESFNLNYTLLADGKVHLSHVQAAFWEASHSNKSRFGRLEVAVLWKPEKIMTSFRIVLTNYDII